MPYQNFEMINQSAYLHSDSLWKILIYYMFLIKSVLIRIKKQKKQERTETN